jgi:hypothetical protein
MPRRKQKKSGYSQGLVSLPAELSESILSLLLAHQREPERVVQHGALRHDLEAVAQDALSLGGHDSAHGKGQRD